MGDTTITKNASGGRYNYADMSQIHGWLEDNNITYYQYIERIEGDDYIYTVPIIDGKELSPRRGCRVVDATLVGVKNPAQEQGSALTYARRYSLLMAFGLCTEDDDAQSLSKEQPKKEAPKREAPKEPTEKLKGSKLPVDDEFDPRQNPVYVTFCMKANINAEIERTGCALADVLSRYGDGAQTVDDIPRANYKRIMKVFDQM